MQIEQRFELPHAPQAVWLAFEDIQLLVDCLPGASLTGEVVEGAVPLRFDVKLGPIKAGFVGNGQLSLDEATRSGSFEGAAADRGTQSRVKGQAQFAVLELPSGTAVEVKVDYALTGSLAQFSRGAIVRELANALTAQFAANLEARIGADLGAEVAVAVAAGALPLGASLAAEAAALNGVDGPTAPPLPGQKAKPAASHTAAPLSLWSLARMALGAWWRRLRMGGKPSQP